MRLLPYGRDALLVEVDDPDLVLPLAEAAAGLEGVDEVVPAARTVLLVLTDGAGAEAVGRRVHALELAALDRDGDRIYEEIVLDVVYDGPDLGTTAAEVGLDADGLVRAHTQAAHVVAFCGFAPGFAYCRGLPAALHVPRLPDPRTRVPAGSVAVAGEFSGVYPSPSPGGWRLLGHTDARLWDVDRDPPALLTPGTRVRFRPVRP